MHGALQIHMMHIHVNKHINIYVLDIVHYMSIACIGVYLYMYMLYVKARGLVPSPSRPGMPRSPRAALYASESDFGGLADAQRRELGFHRSEVMMHLQIDRVSGLFRVLIQVQGVEHDEMQATWPRGLRWMSECLAWPLLSHLFLFKGQPLGTETLLESLQVRQDLRQAPPDLHAALRHARVAEVPQRGQLATALGGHAQVARGAHAAAAVGAPQVKLQRPGPEAWLRIPEQRQQKLSTEARRWPAEELCGRRLERQRLAQRLLALLEGLSVPGAPEPPCRQQHLKAVVLEGLEAQARPSRAAAALRAP